MLLVVLLKTKTAQLVDGFGQLESHNIARQSKYIIPHVRFLPNFKHDGVDMFNFRGFFDMFSRF